MNSEVAYEKLRLAHAGAMSEIEQRCFATPWSDESLRYELTENRLAHYVGAFQGEMLVGYIGLWHIFDEGHITNLAVVPECRQGGIGRGLIAHMMEYAKTLGIARLTLEVRESNAIARALYASMGFEEAGRRKRYYQDNGEDAIIMWHHDLRCHKAAR